VQTDRTLPNNKLDVIVQDSEKGTYVLIDIAISGDRNVIKKEAEKILKYKDLVTEIQCMWNMKTKVIPVIIGMTGTISKSHRQYLSNTPGKHEIKELQETAISGTAHILREVLMYMYKTYFMSKITLHVAQTANTDSYNTLYPRNMVCFRYIIVNTLLKGEKDDDDDDNNNNNNTTNNGRWDSIVNIVTGLQAGLSRV
jgi:hypothetical protein